MTVDPSMPFRSLVRRTLGSERDFQIVASAGSFEQACDQLKTVQTDIVLLNTDVEEQSLLEAIGRIQSLATQACIVGCGDAERTSKVVQSAIRKGVIGYVKKPAVGEDATFSRYAAQTLRDVCKDRKRAKPADAASGAVGSAKGIAPRFGTTNTVGGMPTPSSHAGRELNLSMLRPEVICIGSSTGGPDALAQVVARIDKNFDKPILIAQHMPATFTEQLATRLSSHGKLPAIQGVHGMPLEIGRIYIAPGDFHMELERAGLQLKIILNQGPKVNSCRPAVDVLFRSVASVCGRNTLGIVLTGMGRDGEDGCGYIKRAGGHVWIQDETSSVIWGMPGAVSAAGYADRTFSLEQIAEQLNGLNRRQTRPVAAGSNET
ncbi:MAG: chemotaxis protein CheB [Pirellulales bacterium]